MRSAAEEVRRIADWGFLTTTSRVLDIGCGAGRFAYGILEQLGHVARYEGIDVDEDAIEWCSDTVARADSRFRFHLVGVANERYNPGGQPLRDDFELSFEPESFDIVYMFSVFSHMTDRDIQIYGRAIRRVMADEGVFVTTAFVENDVPEMSINPAGYGQLAWSGPLHCVRYSTDRFSSLMTESGLKIAQVWTGGETDGQSLFLLRRASSARLD